jgi:hypothetical protein
MSALSDLHQALDAVEALIVLEAAYTDPPAPEDRPAAYALRGACTVLTVGCFEQFLRSLFEEEMDRLVSSSIPLSNFPERLRVEASYASLELAMKGDHNTKGLEKRERLAHIRAAARSLATDSFTPRALASTDSNPDSSCVKRMFKTVNLLDVFGVIHTDFETRWKGPAALTFPSGNLDALVNARHQVAHTAEAAHIARNDLRANIRFIKALAETLDARLRSHVDSLLAEAQIAMQRRV